MTNADSLQKTIERIRRTAEFDRFISGVNNKRQFKNILIKLDLYRRSTNE